MTEAVILSATLRIGSAMQLRAVSTPPTMNKASKIAPALNPYGRVPYASRSKSGLVANSGRSQLVRIHSAGSSHLRFSDNGKSLVSHAHL